MLKRCTRCSSISLVSTFEDVYILLTVSFGELQSVVQRESEVGAKLMDKPKQIPFQDGGHSLCLMVDSISSGWASKMPAQYQVRVNAIVIHFFQ